jgi:hypothetical protein
MTSTDAARQEVNLGVAVRMKPRTALVGAYLSAVGILLRHLEVDDNGNGTAPPPDDHPIDRLFAIQRQVGHDIPVEFFTKNFDQFFLKDLAVSHGAPPFGENWRTSILNKTPVGCQPGRAYRLQLTGFRYRKIFPFGGNIFKLLPAS